MIVETKRIGETTREFAKRISLKNNGEKVCICGKLDPMSRGITRILIGGETKLMKNYLNRDKIYEFSIVCGISTDSDDIMGLIDSDTVSESINRFRYIDLIKEYMVNTLKTTTQKYHHYSAICIKKDEKNKKPLWYWYRKGILKEEDIPEKKATVFSVDHINSKFVDKQTYLDMVLYRLNTVTDTETFKIDLIKEKWIDAIDFKLTKIHMLTYRLNVSSGFYIRMIAKDIKNKLKIPVHIFDINRVGI